MVGEGVGRRSFVGAFTALFMMLAAIAVPVIATKYEVWCDCNGDGQADIHKFVWTSLFQSITDPDVACPSCCCKLLRYVDASFVLDPLPALPQTTLPAVPSPTLLPGTHATSSVSSIYVPYTDGAAVVRMELRKEGAPSWFSQSGVIVDTGAAITLFPNKVAVALGLALTSGVKASLSDVSGTPITVWCHRVEIVLLDAAGQRLVPITIVAAFGESDDVPMLLGRKDVLELLDIIFQDDGFRVSAR
jgi:hypothetical protein